MNYIRKINKNFFPYFFFLFTLFILACNFIFNEIGLLKDAQFLELLKFLVILKTLGIGIYFYSKFETIFNPYNLFIFNFFLFILSRVFMDLLGLGEFGEETTFSNQTFSTETQIKTITQIFLCLNAFFLAFLACYKKNFLKLESQNLISAERLFLRNQTLLFFLLCFFFFILLFFKLRVLLFVLSDGYSALQSGNFGSKPIEIFVSEGFFWFISLAFLTLYKKRNIRILALLFILTIVLLDLFSGYRGKSMAFLLMLFWFFENKGVFKASFFKVFLYGFIGILLLVVTNEIRNGRDILDLTVDQYYFVIILFFWLQGFSVHVHTYTNHLENELAGQFGFENLFAIITTQFDKLTNFLLGNRNIDLNYMLENHGYSNYVISNAVNSSNFNNGFTMGTNFIAELNLIGGTMGIYIGTFIFGYFFTFLYEKYKTSSFGFFVILIIFPELIYAPRSTYLLALNNNLIELFLLILIFAMISLFLKKRNEYR